MASSPPPAGTPAPADLEATRSPRLIPILITTLVAAAIAVLPLPLAPPAHRTLVVLAMAAGLWMTEALPVAVTALAIPLLALLLGITDAKGAFAGFGDPIVFLFLGTFLLTDAASQHGLNARLAGAVLGSRRVGGHPRRLLWAVAWLGCGISAWVNNTATTVLLLPLALTAENAGSRRLLVGTLLMCAYAPSLGGIATPVGTAPNLIGLRLLEQVTGERPSFARWCVTFAPLALLGTALTGAWLGRRAGAEPRARPAPLAVRPSEPLRRPWSLAERTLMPLFVVVILLWIAPGLLAATPFGGSAWLKAWQSRLPEPAVPLLGGLLLFVLPSGKGGPILDAGVLRRMDWSTLLLFGGGLSLGLLMFESGLARAIGETIFRLMPIEGTYGIVLAATLMGILVSELTSNTASASLVVPVVLALAQAAGVDPVKPALAATVACSFGFMLPVSTPPNALVYGTGRLTIRDMVVNGALLDLVGALLVSGWVTLFG
ncbi:MAG TPA: DASS family sodium-coupled anion symporter [Candidatus Limnocylindria bacterium]|nr:DASS family sodium-coupled anion symporter [Candidatus Limnocylindria bacterium]